VRARKFGSPLGIEKGLKGQDRTGLLARRDDERRLVAMGGVDVAERVTQSCGRMQIDKAGVAGRLCIAVGHADGARLLQRQHIVDVGWPVAQERQFGRARIAEHRVDAEGAQQLERRLLDGEKSGFECHACLILKCVRWEQASAAQEAKQASAKVPRWLRHFVVPR